MGAIHRVASRRVPTVGPVQHRVSQVELEINRFRQAIKEYFDVRAITGKTAAGISIAGAKDATRARRCRVPFASSRTVSSGRIDGDSDAPSGLAEADRRRGSAGLYEYFNILSLSRLQRMTRMP